MDRDAELSALKRLDLRLIAAELGFVKSRRSSANSWLMEHDDGTKILIGIGSDGHYVFSAVRGHGKGTCVDLWQQYRGGTIGDVRRALRPMLSGNWKGAPPLLTRAYGQSTMLPNLRPIERDTLGVRSRYESFSPLGPHHAYLCEVRGLPPEILSQPAFQARIRVNASGDAVFPHFDEDGLCGYETKGDGFTSFSKGGKKACWASVPRPDDLKLVIAESAIDAISYGVIAGHHRARFLSFSGGMNQDQPRLLQQAMSKMQAGSVIVAAVDNDQAGDGYIVQLRALLDELARPDLTFLEDRPSFIGADWNDELRGRHTGAAAPEPDR